MDNLNVRIAVDAEEMRYAHRRAECLDEMEMLRRCQVLVGKIDNLISREGAANFIDLRRQKRFGKVDPPKFRAQCTGDRFDMQMPERRARGIQGNRTALHRFAPVLFVRCARLAPFSESGIGQTAISLFSKHEL